MNILSDEELLTLFRNADSRHYAFNLLVRQHQRPLYGFIRRMVTGHDDAQDVLQNTFIKAWQGLDRFRGDSKLSSWLWRIAHNECLSHLRRLKRRGTHVSDDAAIERLATTMDSGEHFTGDAIQRRLQRAVMRLPDKQRAVFNMRYFGDMGYEEMSTITGTSVGALKSSHHIAVRKIEGWLATDQTSDGDGAS